MMYTDTEQSVAEWMHAKRSESAGAAVATDQSTPSRVKGYVLPSALIAAFLFLQMFDYHALGMSTVTPDRILFFVIAGMFTFALRKGQTHSLSLSGLEWSMILFGTLCTVSYIIHNPDAGGEHLKWLTTLFNLIVCPFGVYIIAKHTRYDAGRVLWLVQAIALIGVYLAFTAIFEHYRIDALVFPKYIVDPHVGIQFGRARGPMVGSNPMGEWLALVYLAICMYIPHAKTSWKILLQGLILVVIIGIYFTLTRGAWISFAIAAVATAIWGGKYGRPSRAIAIVVLLAFFSGVGSKFSFSGDTLFSRRQNTIDYRLSNNETTYKMGMANFLTGVGYGKFGSNWQKYFDSRQAELTKDLTDGNHNIYLGLFADLGFPGVVLYVTMFGFMLRECIRTFRRLDRSLEFEKTVVLSSIAMIVILLWEGMSGDMRFNPTLNTTTFLLVGIASSIWLNQQRAQRR
jgi:O-antigen ligase